MKCIIFTSFLLSAMPSICEAQFGPSIKVDNVKPRKILIRNDFNNCMKVKLVDGVKETGEKLIKPDDIVAFDFKLTAKNYSSLKIHYRYDLESFGKDTIDIDVNDLFSKPINAGLRTILCPDDDPNLIICVINYLKKMDSALTHSPLILILDNVAKQLNAGKLAKDDETCLKATLIRCKRKIKYGKFQAVINELRLATEFIQHNKYVKSITAQVEKEKSMLYQLEAGVINTTYTWKDIDTKHVNALWKQAPSFELRLYRFLHGREKYRWPLAYLTTGISRGGLMFSSKIDTVFRKDIGISYYHTDLKFGLFPSVNFDRKIMVSINIEAGLSFNFRNEFNIQSDSVTLLDYSATRCFVPESANPTASIGLAVGYKKIILRGLYTWIGGSQILFNKKLLPFKDCKVGQFSLSIPIKSRRYFRYKWRDSYSFHKKPDN